MSARSAGTTSDSGGVRRRFGYLSELERHLARPLVHAWPLDVINFAAVVAGVLSHSVVVWFHIVFLVQAVAALLLPFRRFALRLVIWSSISVALVAWSVAKNYTPSAELSELPLLTTVLVLVFIGAQARGRVVEELTATQTLVVERSESELQALRHQLEQAQRLEMLARASQSMAHDLRNVFTGINCCAVELHEEMWNRSADERVLEIIGATDRGLGIVSDLLFVGRQRPEIDGPIDLGKLTEHLTPLLRRLTPTPIALDVSYSEQPVLVRIDRTSFLQIVMNLVANAADAIEGRGVIKVNCERVVRRRPGAVTPVESAVLSVSDNGPGIPAAVLANVFEPGFTTKSDDHSGLGLATVLRMADRWHGVVDIESSPNGGTTVRLEFPLHDESGSRRALVVLADDAARWLMVDELHRAGFEVMHAANVREAIGLPIEPPGVTLVVLDDTANADPSTAHGLQVDRADHVLVLGGGHAKHRLPASAAEAAQLLGSVLGTLPPATDPPQVDPPATMPAAVNG